MNNLISDLLIELITEAQDCKSLPPSDFEKGRLMGYYICITRILNQMEAFGFRDQLPDSLKNFNPESLLN